MISVGIGFVLHPWSIGCPAPILMRAVVIQREDGMAPALAHVARTMVLSLELLTKPRKTYQSGSRLTGAGAFSGAKTAS